MNAPDTGLDLRDVVWALGALCMAIGGFVMSGMSRLLGRTVQRVDDLERKVITRDELEKKFNEMREDRLTMHRENKEALTRIETKLDGTELNGPVAVRVGKLESEVDRLRTWRHQTEPFIERKVLP